MSIKIAEEQIKKLLADKENKVIAVMGKWGTGKTYFWKRLKGDKSASDNIKNSLYVSLFGIKDLKQLKFKILQSAFPKGMQDSRFFEAIRTARGFLKTIHNGFAVMDDLALLAVGDCVNGKVIVLDDIERKHEDLDIVEVLGFIDGAVYQHKAQFVLIFNNEKLHDVEKFKTYYEKIIDNEIHYQPASGEIFEITKELIVHENFHNFIEAAIEECEIVNIRIIKKIIKIINILFKNHANIEQNILRKLIRSTILMSAVKYKGIECAPEFEDIFQRKRKFSFLKQEFKKEVSDEKKEDEKWTALKSTFGITEFGEYEALLFNYLSSGAMDENHLLEIINEHLLNVEKLQAQYAASEFRQQLFWNHHLSNEQLVEKARNFINTSHFLDKSTVSIIYKDICKLEGGHEVAEKILDNFCENFEYRYDDFDFETMVGNEVNPRIIQIPEKKKIDYFSNINIFEILYSIQRTSGWGEKEKFVINSTKVEDFERIIVNVEYKEFKFLMLKMLDMYKHISIYREHFGEGIDNFILACRNVYSNSPSERIKKVMKSILENQDCKNILQGE